MQLDPITRLSRDLKQAAVTLSDDEARFMVDAYYQMQENRKASNNQVLALSKSGEPHEVLSWLAGQSETLEKQILRALDSYTDSKSVGRWAKSICGIGPVITAGLMAHIDIDRAPTAGHIWRYAGLDPTQKWEKKTKRPWNASLKRLSFIIGECFVKVSGNKNDIYGQYYIKRKALEEQRNAEGQYAEQAAAVLLSKNIGRETEAYKHYSAGKLPPAHIHSRAKRYAVKLFLAHYHHVAYVDRFGKEPPMPYPIAILGHAHYIAPPMTES